MKYTAATLALLAGLAAAQDNPFGDGVPNCAVDCLTAAIAAINCSVDDPACACTSEAQSALTTDTDLVSCLMQGCEPGDLAAAAAGGGAICEGLSATASSAPATETTESASETESATETVTVSETESGTTEESSTGTESASETETTEESSTTTTSEEESETESESGTATETDDAEPTDDDSEEDEDSAAAAPAVFGGAAILAAILAL